mgnify:FL=1
MVGTLIVKAMTVDLGLSESYIRELAVNADSHYRNVKIGDRAVQAPDDELKLVQRWIADVVRDGCPCKDGCVAAYEPGRSIVANAQVHASNAHIVVMDIHHFFRSCTKEMATGVLSNVSFSQITGVRGYHPNVTEVDLLARLSCFSGALAVGSPCSPFIANRVVMKVDREIQHRLPYGCAYTRYSDDITVSSSGWLDRYKIVSIVDEVLSMHGFQLNRKKTRCFGKGGPRKVTGVYILPEGSLGIGKKRKREYEKELYGLLVHGEGSAEAMLGKLDFCKQVDPGYYVKVMGKYASYGSALRAGGVLPALLSAV